MFKMSWYITLGNFRLKMLEKVEIDRSVDTLADTATITLPGMVFNKALEVESKIKRGDKVLVQLGYDDKLVTEFDGYIESIHTDGGIIALNCEDALFLYRVPIDDIQLANVSVTDILNFVNAKVSANYPTMPAFTLSCDYDFRYQKFTIKGATAFDVLKKIQEEAKPNIYLKGSVLHVHPQYSEIFGKTAYDFAVNIDRNGCDLKYRHANERNVIVEIEYTTPDGKVAKVSYGTTGGEKVSLKAGTTDIASLQLLAQQEHDNRVFDGYDGSFAGWLIPYCDAGYQISLNNKDYAFKNGNYYVIGVKTEFSKEGAKRNIKLGKRLS